MVVTDSIELLESLKKHQTIGCCGGCAYYSPGLCTKLIVGWYESSVVALADVGNLRIF